MCPFYDINKRYGSDDMYVVENLILACKCFLCGKSAAMCDCVRHNKHILAINSFIKYWFRITEMLEQRYATKCHSMLLYNAVLTGHQRYKELRIDIASDMHRTMNVVKTKS